MKTLAFFVWILPLAGQQTQASGGKLAFLVQDLLSNTVASVDPIFRTPLDQAIRPRFASINTGVASALSNLPVPSPASAIGYRYNFQAGADVPYPQSLGPILSERSETIGRNKFYLAVTFQRFQFDRLDQVDFRSFQVGIPLDLPILGQNLNGLITADTTISLSVSQTTAHFSYGVTRDLDLTVSLPIVTSSMAVSTGGQFRALNSTLALPFARTGLGADSTGLGDILIRAKKHLVRTKNGGLSLVTDFRVPTGDEFNYHGAGAYGLKPFIAASLNRWRTAPHVNAGYQFNGKSFLATPLAREKARLPGEAFFAVGADASLTRPSSDKHVTLSADLLDRIVLNAPPSQRSDGTRRHAISVLRLRLSHPARIKCCRWSQSRTQTRHRVDL